MKRMSRSLRSTLGAVVVICAFALTLLGTTSVVFDLQETGSAEHHHRSHYDELIFTPIDVPGAVLTVAFGINDRGQKACEVAGSS
jgi:hypothetical protein